MGRKKGVNARCTHSFFNTSKLNYCFFFLITALLCYTQQIQYKCKLKRGFFIALETA